VGCNSWNGYERKCLFANVGGGQFIDVARPLGADADRDGRGVAIADIDGDGRLDVIIANNDAPPTIYLNRLRSAGNWTRLTLQATGGNRDAVGALVRLTVRVGDAAKTMTRQVEAGSGYASQSDMAVHFGLGRATSIEGIDVIWRKGCEQHFAGADLDGLLNRAAYLDEGGRITTRRPASAGVRVTSGAATQPSTREGRP
jgi:enediyne biosynthesis protein E4